MGEKLQGLCKNRESKQTQDLGLFFRSFSGHRPLYF